MDDEPEKHIDLNPSEYRRLDVPRREPIFGPGIWVLLGNEDLWAALIVACIYYWLQSKGYMDVFREWLLG